MSQPFTLPQPAQQDPNSPQSAPTVPTQQAVPAPYEYSQTPYAQQAPYGQLQAPQQPQPQYVMPNIVINNSSSAVATVNGAQGTKTVLVAYLLWGFLGALGAHKFYLGKPGMGVLYLLTLGIGGIGLLVDLFTLPGQVRRANAGL